jgi:hypothetical protein
MRSTIADDRYAVRTSIAVRLRTSAMYSTEFTPTRVPETTSE